MSLTKSEVLSSKPRLKEVEMPEWGGTVWIRPLLLGEQGRLADLGTKFEKASQYDRMKNIVIPLLRWCVCDPEGNPFFDSEDAPALLNLVTSACLRLQSEILSISGLTPESREELEKNLPATPAA